MRASLAWLVPPTVLLILACGGAGSSAATSEPDGAQQDATQATASATVEGTWVRPYLVAGSQGAWPSRDLGPTPVASTDDDPFSGWEAPAGAMAAYFTPSVTGVTGIQVMARSEGPVEVRLLGKPERGASHLATGPWTEVAIDGTRLVGTALSAPTDTTQGFELRLPQGGTVLEVKLLASDGFEPTPTGPWTYYGTRRTSPDLERVDDPSTLRFGTLDPEACTAEKLGGGPDQRLSGTCAPAEGGVQITGSFPPFGAIDEVVPLVHVHPCLAIVDGFPMSRKGCRKKP